METNNSNFIMWCGKCGTRYEVGPLEEVTDCNCGGSLDFERPAKPVDKEEK